MTNQIQPPPQAKKNASAITEADLPTPDLDNRTELDVLFFNTLNQHHAGFHVVAAKVGYRIGEVGPDGYASVQPLDEPAKLATADQHYEDNFRHSVEYESDLAPHKPTCDVLVAGTAYAPAGKAVPGFSVQLQVQAAPLSTGQPGLTLINKHLHIFGPRRLQWQNREWQLSLPQAISSLPLRYEYAAGGACIVRADAPAAQYVPTAERLPAKDEATQAIAFQVAETNPVGLGFSKQWYWDAHTKTPSPETSLTAPQIVYAGHDFTVADFKQTLSTGQMPTPAGLGVIGRGWLPRRALVGTVDENKQWQADEVPSLPMDFDFAYWNAAPKDQQCPYLQGGEEIRLMNLTAPGAGIGKSDATGNQHLKLRLPHHACVLLLGIPQNGEEHLQVERMVIDTVLIKPDQRRLELTWRSLIEVERDVTRMRFLFLDKPDQLLRIKALENIAEMNRAPLNQAASSKTAHNLPQGRK